jgi:hypothetical protein
MRLIPCSRCQRHVRLTDSCCPFCGTSKPTDGGALPGLRLVFAVGAAALVACGGTVESGEGAMGGSSGSSDQDAGVDAVEASPDVGFGGGSGSGGADASLEVGFGGGSGSGGADASLDVGFGGNAGGGYGGAAYGPPPQ